MQKITVFQQNNSGESKIAGIKKFGKNTFEIETINIDQALPDIIDNTSEYLPKLLDTELVLDYLKHPDLSYDLAMLCKKQNIPIVASGKKIIADDVIKPSICCSLANYDQLGEYGKLFGYPSIDIKIKDGIIDNVDIKKGAPCGATWNAAQKIKGLKIEDAAKRYGLEVQFFCSANPANWDPIGGKSPVHLAADVHESAFKKALKDS